MVYFIRCQLNPGGSMILLSSSVPLQIFCRIVLSVTERGVFQSPPIITDWPISPFSSIVFCSLLFGTYIFRTATYFWWTDSFTIYNIFLCLIIFFPLKSNLCDINHSFSLLIKICKIYLFFHPFAFNLPILLQLKLLSFSQHVHGSWFLVHSDISVFYWFILTT